MQPASTSVGVCVMISHIPLHNPWVVSIFHSNMTLPWEVAGWFRPTTGQFVAVRTCHDGVWFVGRQGPITAH